MFFFLQGCFSNLLLIYFNIQCFKSTALSVYFWLKYVFIRAHILTFKHLSLSHTHFYMCNIQRDILFMHTFLHISVSYVNVSVSRMANISLYIMQISECTFSKLQPLSITERSSTKQKLFQSLTWVSPPYLNEDSLVDNIWTVYILRRVDFLASDTLLSHICRFQWPSMWHQQTPTL